MKNQSINRREFLTRSAKIGAAAVVAPTLISSCAPKGDKLVALNPEGTYYVPELPDKAIDGRALKAGLIGCGGRGTGAVTLRTIHPARQKGSPESAVAAAGYTTQETVFRHSATRRLFPSQ